MDIKEYLKSKKILCDGAFGTYYATFSGSSVLPERANINDPEMVKRIHKEYMEAGAVLIRTNTFAANTYSLSCSVEELQDNIRSSVRLARAAQKESGKEIILAGDIGPQTVSKEECSLICNTLIEEGIDCLLFETLSEYESILEIVKEIKEKKDIFVIFQFSINQHGYTSTGISARRILEEIGKIPEVEAIGFNCGVGPGHLCQILSTLSFPEHKYLTALPNASYPKIQQDRMVFLENIDYFAQKCAKMAHMGIDFIGGCCGTTPEYILKTKQYGDFSQREREKPAIFMKSLFQERKKDSSFYANKKKEEKLIAVELAPPFHSDDEKIMEAAHFLKDHYADVVTFPDSPSGRTRADSIMIGIKAEQTAGVCAMPHICCRDKNAIAIRAQLLGAYMNGIRNLLVITGDPIPSMMRKDIKSVYNFDAVGMMRIIQEMNEEEFALDPIVYGGALNHNRLNTEVEIERMKKKMAAGASFFLTQPLFTEAEAVLLKEIKQKTGARILCGMMPLVSRKNAIFIQNEMAGIQVTEDIVNRYCSDMTREEGERVGVSIARDIMNMTKDFVEGYYFSIPFNRVYLLDQILKNKI